MKLLLIRISLTILVCITTLSAFAQEKKNWIDKVGVVFLTYRHSFAKDVALTLDTIKSTGLTDVEFSNLFGRTAQEIRALLDERGMTCSSFGVGYPDLMTKTDEVANNAKTLGARFVRVAWIPHEGEFSIEHVKKAVEDFNSAGKILREKYNLTFCYHNHGYEFKPYEKGTMFDYIVKETNPEDVSFELDILWAHHPGADPAKLLRTYGERFRLIHMKDLKKGVKGDFSGKTDVKNDVILGTGQIDIPSIIKALPKTKVEHLYIEDESPTASKQVPLSLDYLKKLSKK